MRVGTWNKAWKTKAWDRLRVFSLLRTTRTSGGKQSFNLWPHLQMRFCHPQSFSSGSLSRNPWTTHSSKTVSPKTTNLNRKPGPHRGILMDVRPLCGIFSSRTRQHGTGELFMRGKLLDLRSSAGFSGTSCGMRGWPRTAGQP